MRTSFTQFTPLLESARPAIKTDKGALFRGVTLIRAGIGNRKDKNYYPPETLQKAVPMFNGLRAFADHPDSVSEEIQPERSIRDMVGIYENARYNAKTEAIEADLHILKPHQWLADTVDELIRIGHADKIGLSINGQGQTAPYRMTLAESGEEVDVNRVDRFIHLRSTDIVTEAGAGGGFPQLLESARAEALQETRPMNLLAAIKEASDQGDLKKVKALLADAAKADETKEAVAKPKAKAKAKPAEDVEDAEGAADGEDTVVDHDAELDAAVEAAQADADPTDGDNADGDDADGDDAEGDDAEGADAEGETTQEADEDETPDTQVDATRAAASARDRFKAHKTAEAAIKGATGKKTGTVNSGVGSFTKPERTSKKGSKVPMKAKQVFRTRESAAGVGDDVAQLRRAVAKRDQQIADLSEALRTRKSIDTARKLLKESALPADTRALMLDDLVGLPEREQRRVIEKQVRLIESVKHSVIDTFDDIEGSGTSLRESFAGGGQADSFEDLFTEVGLTLKG